MDVFKGYANAAGATFWLHDVVLDFGLKEPETQGDEMQPDELVCRLHMSPQHFKALVAHLDERLSQYESVYGTINLQADQEALQRLQAAAARAE